MNYLGIHQTWHLPGLHVISKEIAIHKPTAENYMKIFQLVVLLEALLEIWQADLQLLHVSDADLPSLPLGLLLQGRQELQIVDVGRPRNQSIFWKPDDLAVAVDLLNFPRPFEGAELPLCGSTNLPTNPRMVWKFVLRRKFNV